MSRLGRWWGAGRGADARPVADDDRAVPGAGPATGSQAAPPAGWGTADDVDLGPAPPPDAESGPLSGPPSGPLPGAEAPLADVTPWPDPDEDDGGGAPTWREPGRSAELAESAEAGESAESAESAEPVGLSAMPTVPHSVPVPSWSQSERPVWSSTEPPWRRSAPTATGPLPAVGRAPAVPATSGPPERASSADDAGRAPTMSSWFDRRPTDPVPTGPGPAGPQDRPTVDEARRPAPAAPEPTTPDPVAPGPAPADDDVLEAAPVDDERPAPTTPIAEEIAAAAAARENGHAAAPEPPTAAPEPERATEPEHEPTPEPEPAPEPEHTAIPAPRTVGADTPPAPTIVRADLAQGRLGIDHVAPEIDGGRIASKAVTGEVVPVTATVWREGHDAVAATVVWQRCAIADHREDPGARCPGSERTTPMRSAGPETDRFVGAIVPDAEGLWSFRVEAWSDPWATWRHAVEVKAAAGQGAPEMANDLEIGARLLERAVVALGDRPGPGAPDPAPLVRAIAGLRDEEAGLPERLAAALAAPVHRLMVEHPVRELVTPGRTHHVVVERRRALDGAWYEFFPRSTGGVDADGRPVHGTFATAAAELDRVAAMGFDVAYLPPIHPVGHVNRKGPNNTLTPGPDDVGSPWAIGSPDGGHDAVHPELGTLDDFDAFVARAHALGLEVALDLALQCAPDHPWASEHPEWFTTRPDGTIAYAENPPKRYQDIYPVNFDDDPDGLSGEVLRIVLGWIDHGVRIFRVDNPHTKPPDFWAWLIAEVHRRDAGVVFLAEAFTRPARLFGLARAGFSQSYTYFTWRTGREELQEFFELHRDRIDECRPNCFVNTPDILHASLQEGGPGMFALRAALAATLSPSWGVYAGFELFEGRAVRPGSEEYLDSEKYQLRPRDFAGALAAGRSLEPWITRLNQIRRAHPALRTLRTLRFHDVDNPALIAYSKTDPVGGDTVLCVVTLNPFAAEEGTLFVDAEALGLTPGDRFAAVDEVSGQTFDWGPANFVRLEPWRDVAHVVSVLRR